MSILLNALNKSRGNEDSSDEIDHLIDSPIDEEEVSDNNVNYHFWFLGLLSIIALALVAIVGLMVWDRVAEEPMRSDLVSQKAPTQIESQVTQQKVVDKQLASEQSQKTSIEPEQAQQQSNSENKSDNSYFESYAPTRQTQRPKAEVKTPVKQQTPSVSSNRKVDSSLPIREITQLTDVERMMVEEVTVDAHVYSEDAAQRFIFVGGELKQEGQMLINSWQLETIEEQGVIINNGVLRVRIPQGK